MTSIADRPVEPLEVSAASPRGGAAPLGRAAGLEMLGEVSGTGYKGGAALVRRADGQVVQLGPLMYALLDSIDGWRDTAQLAVAASDRLGRTLEPRQVEALAEKLAALGLLAGTEHLAPAKRNPLLALRWKVLISDPMLTRRLTAPFSWLFSGWIMWPALAAFAAVCWFVLVDKGVASATAQAFDKPGLLLLVFALTVLSAGFHEFGHAAACRRGGATPGGMGFGLYLVWPAFYTDVTDAYRLPRRARLRVDLAGLYFNALVAVATMAAWLAWRVDALLLLVAMQLLQMVKQLSPVMRADGYHILADATGVPDLFAHIGPTLRRLLPGHRHEPSALSGRARLLVTLWVLVIVPVMLSLMISAVLLLPRLLTTAYASGSHLVGRMPHQGAVGVGASLLQLAALVIPVAGSTLVTVKVARMAMVKAAAWSAGSPTRRGAALLAGAAVVGGLAWAWWPSGQYQQVRPTDRGSLPGLLTLLRSPHAAPHAAPAAHVLYRAAALPGGTHLAVAMVPVGGATAAHPALLVVPGADGAPATAFVVTDAPAVGGTSKVEVTGTAFPFTIPPADTRPGDNQAIAVNTTNGAVRYDIAYSLVTVTGTGPVTNHNSAFAMASCQGCTTVAVSFQVVLVVGQHSIVAPIDAAGALNDQCPACSTTAIADQLVISLKSAPSKSLLAELQADLQRLDALPALGAQGTPPAIAATVAQVQQEVGAQLQGSGDVAASPTSSTSVGGSSTTMTTTSSAASSSNSTSYATASTTSTTSPQSTTSTTNGASTTASAPTSTTTVTTAATATSTASSS